MNGSAVLATERETSEATAQNLFDLFASYFFVSLE